MALGPGATAQAVVVARAGFATVVLAAAVSGLALLVAPEATGRFFSWGLGPPPLASLVGGLYVASAVVFGVAVALPWTSVRPLVGASVALSGPTLIATLLHLDVFDFGRWQAWAWILLFTLAPPFWTGLLVANRRRAGDGGRRATGPPAAALLGLAAALGLGALLLWVAPEAGSRALPFSPSPLGGRFAGSWAAFLAVMAAWAALRPREADLCLLALALYPAGAAVAGLRSFADLGPVAARWGYLVVCGVLTVAFAAALARRSAAGTVPVHDSGEGS